MKKLVLILSIITFTIISCKEEKQKKAATKTSVASKKATNLSTTKNVIVWKGYKPTGSHNGTINIKNVNLKFENKTLTGGNVIFDMKTIKDRDLKDPKDNADLVGHLSSPDFFDTIKYPTAKFVITEVNSDKEGVYQIKGNLTIKDISNPISFNAKLTKNENGTKTLKSEIIKIDRTKFNIKYKSKTFFNNLKNAFINDEFDIAFKITI